MPIVKPSGNTVERLIQARLPSFSTLTGQSRAVLVDMCVRYLFRLTTSQDFAKTFRTVFNDKKLRVIDLKQDLITRGDLAKNVKMWLYYLIKNGKRNTEQSRQEYKVRVRDTNIPSMLSQTTKQSIASLDYPVMALSTMDNILTYALTDKDIQAFTAKFVYRKMRFVYTQNGQQAEDLINQLLTDGMVAVLHYYPQISSQLHLDNIIKRKIHNCGIGIIDSYTTNKRSRMVATKDGYETVTVNMDDDILSNYAGSFNQEEELENEHTVTQLIRRYSDKKRYFLQLMTGSFDNAFTAWLSQNRISVANDDYYEKAGVEKYLAKVSSYLQVPMPKLTTFMQSLKKELAA